MRLPQAPDRYNRDAIQQAFKEIEGAVEDAQRRDQDVLIGTDRRFMLVSSDGTMWPVTVANDGSLLVNGVSQGGATSFAGLSDTPASIGSVGYLVSVNSAGDALEFIPRNAITFKTLGDTPATLGSAGQYVAVSGDGMTLEFVAPPAPSGPQKISIYNTSDTGLSGSWTEIAFHATHVADTAFSLTSNHLVVNEAATCLLTAHLTTYGGGRASSFAKLQADNGSGWSDIPGTEMGLYNRQTSNGWTNAAVSLWRPCAAGEKIRMVAYESGASNIVALGNYCGLTAAKW